MKLTERSFGIPLLAGLCACVLLSCASEGIAAGEEEKVEVPDLPVGAVGVCSDTVAPSVPAPSRTFYVNAQSGNDNATGTSPSTAWRTLNKANSTAQPGDLFLLRGTFSNQVIHPERSGTASAKIVYREDPGATAILEGGQYDVIVWLDELSHVVVDGLELRNAPNPVLMRYSGGHNWLRNLWIHDLGTNQIMTSSDNRIENSVIEGCGSESANAGECIWIADGAHRNVIANNTIRNAGHGLVGVGGDKTSMSPSEDNRVVSNDLDNPWASNVLIYGPGTRTVVECNKIHNTSTSGVNYARTGIQINGVDNVVRYNEIFDNMSDGIQIQGYSFQGLMQNATGNQIYHNTVYNNGGAGLEIVQKDGDVSNNVIQNNIFWGNNTLSQRTWGGEKWDIWIDLYNANRVWPQGSLNGNVIRNNIMASSAADAGKGWMLIVRSAGGNYQYTRAQAESTFSGVSANLETNPLFVNAGSGDFLLQSGSPAIDAGLAISGMSFLGPAPDLGAHEAR